MGWKQFIGNNTTPSAKIMSSFVSLGVLVAIFLNLIPDNFLNWAYYAVGFHLLNHIYVGFSEIRQPTCHKCGKDLDFVMKIKKHRCR